MIPFMIIVYRINTFPLIHVGFLHALLNVLALTPLLERFEAEHGTLTTIALFFGRMYSLDGAPRLWTTGTTQMFASCEETKFLISLL
jgi:hypothetical protein